MRDAWPQLEHLALKGHGVGPGAADALLAGGVPRLSRLRTLELNWSGSGMRLSNVVLKARWPVLEQLSLVQHSRFDPGGAGLDFLIYYQGLPLDPAKLPMLRLLCLEGICLGDVGLRAMAQHVWPALAECRLLNSSLTESGAAALAAAGAAHFPALRVLDVSRNTLGNAGVAALAGTAWPLLHKLKLSDTWTGRQALMALGAAGPANFPALHVLDLSEDDVGRGWPAGAAALPLAASD